MPPDPRFLRGAIPSPQERIAAAPKFRSAIAAPAEFCRVPEKLDVWGNDRFGVCVTSEEAYNKACHSPEIFIQAEAVIGWARAHGVLNGATLIEVLDAFQNDGFRDGNQQYNDGPYFHVDWKKVPDLQAALVLGPVKIAMGADALPHDAGNRQGWYITGKAPRNHADHCVALTGYGTAEYLYRALGVPLPPALKPDHHGYLLFTWGTVGFVDQAWLNSTCVEAWVRNPTNVGVPPLPEPGPGPEPEPDPQDGCQLAPGVYLAEVSEGVRFTPIGSQPILLSAILRRMDPAALWELLRMIMELLADLLKVRQPGHNQGRAEKVPNNGCHKHVSGKPGGK